MSKDLIMDVSKELFKLDKDELNFTINSAMISKLSTSSTHSVHLKPLSETEITVTNLTSDYIAFRIKTTKKANYSVQPSHCVLNPNGTQTIKIIYYDKPGQKINSKDHKFRFEGIVIPEAQKNEPLNELFRDYAKKEIKVQGNSLKLLAKFTQEENLIDNIDNNMSNDNNNKLDIIKEDEKEIIRTSTMSNASVYTIPDESKSILEENNTVRLSDLIINNNKSVEMTDKERLENLKMEYNQLKEEVEILKTKEETLNKEIRNEKNKKNIIPQSEKFIFYVPENKEKPISRNMLLGIFAFSALIGFYLIK